MKVLVTDCFTRKSLSAVRSLGKKGLTVHAASHTRIAPGLYSKYVSKYFIIPHPKKNPSAYLANIIHILKEGNYHCLLPFEEASIEIFLANRNSIEALTQLPIPDKAAYELASNKWQTLQLAQQLGIPIPTSFLPLTTEALDETLNLLSFPIIIKPVHSSGSRGLYTIRNKENLDIYYNKVVKKYGFPLLQECIPPSGEGCGVGILASQGEVLVSFSYKRLREFPVSGGPSTLRESTHDEQLKDYASRLIKALKWTGVAMIEFKRDPDTHIPKLMEINPRFWGSLALAQAAGINFPYLLFALSQGEKISQITYESGILCRWLLPGDLAHFIANKDRFSLKPSFFHFFDKNLFYDDFDKKDIKGNIAVIFCSIAMIFSREVWKIGLFRK